MNSYSYYQALTRQNEKLINDVEKAINGEYSAIQCYEKIANLAPTAKERNQILEIRQDEVKHFQKFSQIYTQLTGKQPQHKVTEKCPKTYEKGLDFAFLDEQKTVDFYSEIASYTSDPYIKETFLMASRDEQNHAVWFLYYLTRKKR